MKQEDKTIEIPFGAFDSELGGFEYTIPEGYEAEIKDGKVIVRKAESEDEKIRKGIIKFLIDVNNGAYTKSELEIASWITWLEKQGEQKPIECSGKIGSKHATGKLKDMIDKKENSAWSEEDKKMFVNIKACLRNADKDYSREVDWLKSLRPQKSIRWNDADEAHLHSLVTHLEQWINRHPDTTGADVQGENLAWLKSLSPKSYLKPTEEQLEALQKIISGFASVDFQVLKRLHTELKAL